jgi:hypothetical protein
MSTQIQIKRGTAAALSLINPTLAAGEWCYETDTLKYKIGDGVNDWNTLTYAGTNHTHTTTNITDFNTAVSGLIPAISGSGDISISFVDNLYTIAYTGVGGGLTQEEVDDRVAALLVEGDYIGLAYDDGIDTLTITVTGVQPSGDYSLEGHIHVSSDITDFNASVSGLLPSISGIDGYLSKFDGSNDINQSVIYQSGTSIGIGTTSPTTTLDINGNFNAHTINVSGVALNEYIDDEVSNLLVAGTGIILDYVDEANSLTITSIFTFGYVLSDTVDSTNYIGTAPTNSLTSDSVWTIKKTVYNSDGSVFSFTVATNVKWDDRETVTYT